MSEDVLPLEENPEIRALLSRELEEDIGPGDATTLSLVDKGSTARANLVARQPLVLSGILLAAEVFRMVDSDLKIDGLRSDGQAVEEGASVLRLEGSAQALLTAERTALNLLQRMTGIATATAQLVRLVSDFGTLILDTRKTVPGLRQLDKYAVKCGGGTNHRVGLHDAILIKDNHLAFWREKNCGTLADAVRAAREAFPGLKIEIEVDTLEQLAEALPGNPDWVLLDNMSPSTIVEAVALCGERCKTEASGGITLETVREYAQAGVTAISIGALTHSPKAADLALDFE